NWVVAVSDSADPLVEQIDARRKQMESALADTLSNLTLAQSGFVFVFDAQQRMIVPPPEQAQRLWKTDDAATGQSLPELLQLATGHAGPRGESLGASGDGRPAAGLGRHFLFDSGSGRWR